MSTRKRNAWRSELVPARVGISVTPGEMLRTIREIQELRTSEGRYRPSETGKEISISRENSVSIVTTNALSGSRPRDVTISSAQLRSQSARQGLREQRNPSPR